MLLKEKVAIVTGGSRGIGKEIVLALLKEGAIVYFLDLLESEHLSQMQEQAKKTNTSVFFKKADVSNEKEIAGVIDQILKQADGIDILVNNAGITRDGLIFRMTTENWEKVLKINLTSAFIISRSIARDMIKKRKGCIINMASIVGVIGNAGQTNYSASKAGLIGFTKSLAREVASRGVRVNAIAPGFIDTQMTKVLGEKTQEAILKQIPMGKMGDPKDVANAVVFLASDKASYITGHVLHVDGGMAM